MATGLGIDIGAESIKVVQARISGGAVTVIGALKLPRNNETLLDAPTNDNGNQFVPEHLGAELKRAGLRRSGTLGVSGREIQLKYLPLAPMPPDRLKMVVDMEVGGKLTNKQVAADMPALTYDYRLLNIPSGLKGDLLVMSAVCKNEYLFGVNAALKKAGLRAEKVTPACLGLVNAYLRSQKIPEKETVVLVDVGHELMEIAILEENRLYFARSAPGGGKKFTAALDKVLKVGALKAAEFKHGRARLYPEGAQTSGKQELAFQAALREGADNIANAIRSSVTFCRAQAKLPKLDYQRIFLSGGGARLSGLREYLEKKTGRPAQALDLSSGLDLRKLDAESARCFEGETPDMTIALGLAVIDADPQCFHFALVPEVVARKRIFWRKTVFGIAAGILLLFGLYWPLRNSDAAVVAAQERVALFQQKKIEAKTEKEEFAACVEQNRILTQKIDYYGRQTRLNRIYLEMLARLRSELPNDTHLSYIGPATDSEGSKSVLGFGHWNITDEPMRKFIARGYYDVENYPGTKFEEAWDNTRKKLLEVPGIEQVERENLIETDVNIKPGVKLFQFNLTLQDPSKRVIAVKTASVSLKGNEKTAP